MNNRDKRVLVGMSGGIDSSATCIMLQEQGYEVVGVTMRTWDVPSRFSTPGQDEPDDVLEAKALAERLGIEHHVADVRKEFKQIIVKHFIDEYMQGRTPNPCVLCNPLFKERILCEWADQTNCAHISTGHYCRLEERKGKLYIVAGDDQTKRPILFSMETSSGDTSTFSLSTGNLYQAGGTGISPTKGIRSEGSWR